MTRVNIAQAKARFSELLRKAISGEEVIIARDNKPLVKLVPLGTAGRKRVPGSARGLVRMAPDFDVTPPDFEDYT